MRQKRHVYPPGVLAEMLMELRLMSSLSDYFWGKRTVEDGPDALSRVDCRIGGEP